MTKRETTEQRQVEDLLALANGRRRQRILGLPAVARVLREARDGGLGYTTGGRVANAYSYPAYTSALVAVRRDDNHYALYAATINARKSTSPVHWFGARSIRNHDLAAWLTQFLARPAPQGWLVVTARTARQMIRAERGESAEIPAELAHAETLLTQAHSLDAGNCEHETRRVATWFSETAVPISRVLQTVRRREPSLLPYAIRAARRALDTAAV